MTKPRTHQVRAASIPIRMSQEERDIIGEAAVLEGRDRSQFMRYHAMQAAKAALGLPATVKAGAANGEAR
jgi:uncharacterized protein (DUF1778 family)